MNDGDTWEMEVDLRSREKEKRTLHWFVNGKQQKGFIKGVPDSVQFGVCFFSFIFFLFLFYISLLVHYSYLFRYAHIIKVIALNLHVLKSYPHLEFSQLLENKHMNGREG